MSEQVLDVVVDVVPNYAAGHCTGPPLDEVEGPASSTVSRNPVRCTIDLRVDRLPSSSLSKSAAALTFLEEDTVDLAFPRPS